MEYSVFLSYRRADTAGHAGRLCDDLERHFNRPLVFRDVDAISAGTDFVLALQRAIAVARVVIVLIGDDWLAASTDGRRRLDDVEDHVRREVEMALQDDDVQVLPVLVEGACMPTEQQLPESLRGLARLQAIALSEDRWEFDVTRLARALERAGVARHVLHGVPRWLMATTGLLLLLAALGLGWCWWGGQATEADYTGLWHLPNGNHWTVRPRDGQLWVEETHHESGQVWKRGKATLQDGQLIAKLELVFDRVDFHYRHELRLADDKQSLIGLQRRSNLDREHSVVLSRRRE